MMRLVASEAEDADAVSLSVSLHMCTLERLCEDSVGGLPARKHSPPGPGAAAPNLCWPSSLQNCENTFLLCKSPSLCHLHLSVLIKTGTINFTKSNSAISEPEISREAKSPAISACRWTCLTLSARAPLPLRSRVSGFRVKYMCVFLAFSFSQTHTLKGL